MFFTVGLGIDEYHNPRCSSSLPHQIFSTANNPSTRNRVSLHLTHVRFVMIDGNYPPPKYDEIVKNDNGNIITSSTTAVSLFPPPLPPLRATSTTNISENIATASPFRVNLIPSTAPVFGPNPIESDCPYCQAHIVTSIQRIVGALPWIVMAICFLLGFFLLLPWCLCCVPFYMDNCRDVIHSCPSCKRILGRFTRI